MASVLLTPVSRSPSKISPLWLLLEVLHQLHPRHHIDEGLLVPRLASEKAVASPFADSLSLSKTRVRRGPPSGPPGPRVTFIQD